jgi:hypothetical protein
MRWDDLLPGGSGLTAHEEGNRRAAEARRRGWVGGSFADYPEYQGWVGLIHYQRAKRIVHVVVELEARLTELHEHDPQRYYDGEWREVYDGLIHWRTRDPFNEAHWTAVVQADDRWLEAA